jgi:tetratricopeptide (TPR) repeat protein
MIRAQPRVALQVWIVLFIVFFGAEVVHLEPNLRVITQLLYGVPLVAWAAWRLRGPYDRLDWAVLGLLGVYLVVCLLSRDPTESIGTLALATAFAAWFLLMRRVGTDRATIVTAAATGLAITLAYNAFLLVQEKVQWYQAVGGAPFEGRMTFPWESVNALPMLVLAAVPFVAWVERSQLRMALGAIVALSALVVVPISLGRAGWLGLVIAGVTFAVIHPRTMRLAGSLQIRSRVILAVFAAVLAVVVIAIAGPRLWRAVAESGRGLLWEQGVAIAADNIVDGVGPGIYSWARLEYPPPAADLLELRLVHNVPIGILIDGGVLLALGLMGAGVAYAMTAARTPIGWSMSRRIGVSCLIGFLAAFTLDDVSYLPALTALVLTIAALEVPIVEETPSAPLAAWRGLVLPAMLALATVIAMPKVVAVDMARIHGQAGRAAMVDGRYDDARAEFEAAAAAHPESGGYWLGLGMAQAYDGNTTAAIDAFRRAIAASPGDPRGYAALAALDPPADEVAMLRAAADRTLGDPQFAVRLGSALVDRGNLDGAVQAWGRAVELQPQLLRLLPYGDSGIDAASVAGEALRIIESEPRPGPHENEVELWDIGLAIDDLPADAEPAWRAVDAARHGDLATAQQLADEAVQAAPYEAHGYQARAAIAAFECDPEAERAALSLERIAVNAWSPLEPDPRLRREFIYREASLGPSQPPGVGLGIVVERWPWPLIDRPSACP